MQPARDLLGAPGLRPAPVLAPTVSPADPPNLGAVHRPAVRALHSPRETILHIPSQLGVHGQLGRPRTSRPPVCMPLRSRRLVLQTTATGRGVPAQLPRDRRRRTTKLTRDLAHATAAS